MWHASLGLAWLGLCLLWCAGHAGVPLSSVSMYVYVGRRTVRHPCVSAAGTSVRMYVDQFSSRPRCGARRSVWERKVGERLRAERPRSTVGT
jgi:hypothetical protein